VSDTVVYVVAQLLQVDLIIVVCKELVIVVGGTCPFRNTLFLYSVLHSYNSVLSMPPSGLPCGFHHTPKPLFPMYQINNTGLTEVEKCWVQKSVHVAQGESKMQQCSRSQHVLACCE
jgi:hypothetical protein